MVLFLKYIHKINGLYYSEYYNYFYFSKHYFKYELSRRVYTLCKQFRCSIWRLCPGPECKDGIGRPFQTLDAVLYRKTASNFKKDRPISSLHTGPGFNQCIHLVRSENQFRPICTSVFLYFSSSLCVLQFRLFCSTKLSVQQSYRIDILWSF